MNSIARFTDRFRFKKEEYLISILAPSMPVYHYHIRKTAGTSINFAFLQQSKNKNLEDFYSDLAAKPDHRIISNKKIFVGWNRKLIKEEKYHYAFSHMPAHELGLSSKVFKITCFRDPLKRLISHYNMLAYYKETRNEHPCMKVEGPWIEDGFSGFIKTMDKKALFAQLYMFSPDYNVKQAIDFLRQNKVFVLKTEDLTNDLNRLSQILSLKLESSNQKSYNFKSSITEAELDYARQLLDPEYQFLSEINEIFK